MSDRERWIVYPLLFLALLQSQRDAWRASYGTARFKSIACNSIDVQSPAGASKVRIVGNPNTGLINVYGSGPQRCVAVTTKNGGNAGHLELIHALKYSGVRITADPVGGVAEFSGAPTLPAMRVGIDPQTNLVGVFPANSHLIPIEVELSEEGLSFRANFPNSEKTVHPNEISQDAAQAAAKDSETAEEDTVEKE